MILTIGPSIPIETAEPGISLLQWLLAAWLFISALITAELFFWQIKEFDPPESLVHCFVFGALLVLVAMSWPIWPVIKELFEKRVNKLPMFQDDEDGSD